MAANNYSNDGEIDIELMYQLEAILSGSTSNNDFNELSNNENNIMESPFNEANQLEPNNDIPQYVIPFENYPINRNNNYGNYGENGNSDADNEEVNDGDGDGDRNDDDGDDGGDNDGISDTDADAILQSEIEMAIQVSLNGENLSRFQNNIDQVYQQAGDIIEYEYPILPISMCSDCYDELIYNVENSNQIIIPQHILNDLSKYNNINYPLTFSFEGINHVLSIKEIKNTNSIYVPYRIFKKLNIEPGQEGCLQLLNTNFPKGTKVVLQACTSNFIEIENHKEYLEKELCTRYTYLTQGETITLPLPEYLINFDDASSSNNFIQINIISTEPAESIYLINTDLEVETLAPLDYVPPIPPPVAIDSSANSNLNSDSKYRFTYNPGSSSSTGLNMCISEKEQSDDINGMGNEDTQKHQYMGPGHTVGGDDDDETPKEDEIDKIRQLRIARFEKMRQKK